MSVCLNTAAHQATRSSSTSISSTPPTSSRIQPQAGELQVQRPSLTIAPCQRMLLKQKKQNKKNPVTRIDFVYSLAKPALDGNKKCMHIVEAVNRTF